MHDYFRRRTISRVTISLSTKIEFVIESKTVHDVKQIMKKISNFGLVILELCNAITGHMQIRAAIFLSRSKV